MTERLYSEADMARFAGLYQEICHTSRTFEIFGGEKSLRGLAAQVGLDAIIKYESFPDSLRSQMNFKPEDVKALEHTCQEELKKSSP
jgi:hypothetical protein